MAAQLCNMKIKTNRGSYQGSNQIQSNGLSPKEKKIVICACQAKATRYKSLKELASKAIAEHRIFSVYGYSNAVPIVRKALLERGWIEKLPPNRMNLAKIRNGTYSNKSEIHGELERLLLSNFVEKCPANFIWRTHLEIRDNTIDMNKEFTTTVINKLTSDTLWTTKQGLCSSIKRNYWFYIEDVAEVNGPRSYNTYDLGEIEGFIKDYKITACTSLLKWVVSMNAYERPVFVESGKISLNLILFALNRCKEYLYKKQNKDIDRPIADISPGQWNGFLKKYYRIIGNEDTFRFDKENVLPIYMDYAKFLLKEMYRYRPQMSCEGCYNVWIIKPAHNSRGRGIRMASKLGVISSILDKANHKYVIQKYIEDPLLIHETKFDIRQYYLVTSTFPLVIWMYKDCYLKFSSQKYSLKNYHESIHLTNNAVQKKYKNCSGRHEELPSNNMWDMENFKEHLIKINKIKAWDNIIYPGMKKSIISIMLSCQDSLSVSKNRFELYGCDFILDKEYKPWLIEINSCPDLNHTTQVTAKICSSVVSDIVKVVIDYPNNSSSSTGKFESIYRQPMTMPRYGGAADLIIRGYALPKDYFYKGNIKIEESFNDEINIAKDKDITSIMNKIKQHYDTDTIMREPEEAENVGDIKEEASCTHHAQSECELRIAATVITAQLEEIVNKVTAESTSGTPKRVLPSSGTSVNSGQCITSISNIKSLFRKCLSRKDTADGNGKEYSKFQFDPCFKFSALNVGTRGKASQAQVISSLNLLDGKINSNLSNMSRDFILQATSKIVQFINVKEREYFKDCHSKSSCYRKE